LSSDLYKVLRCGTAGVDVQSARALLAEVGMHTRRMSTLALCLLVVRPAFADEQSSPAAATQLVIVDVAVTDKKGRLVTGLRADAFEIYEDGGLVPFENFRAPGEAPPAAGVAEQAIPAPPAPVAAPLLVVYVDNDNLGPANRSRVLDGLKRSLDERLAAGGTRMLLVGDVQGVKALTGVTAERREVAAAIDVLARSTARGDQASDERSTLEIVHDIIKMADETPFMGGCLGVLEDVISVLRRHAVLRSQRVGLTVGRLSTLVQALGSLPGPKTLLYVSEGFEQRPGIHLFQQLGEICPEALTKEFSKVHAPMGEHDASPMLRELVALANVLRVTIYTFDAAGLRGGSLASPESKDRRYVPSSGTEAIRTANLQYSQQLLSEGTGGLSAFNSNLPDAFLARLGDDVARHYTLGYAPAHEPEGGIHQIQVRLKGPRAGGLQLRYRESYRHQVPAERASERVLAALVFGVTENPLGVSVAAGQPIASSGSRTLFDVPLRITLPAGSREGSAVRLLLGTRAAGGRPAIDTAVRLREKTIEVPGPTAQDVVVNLALEAGEYDVAVGVFDVSSGGASYVRLHLAVEGPSGSR
jgi:VWFA-related protein